MASLAPKKTSSQNGPCRIQSQIFGRWFMILISQQLSCYIPHQIQNHHSTKEIMVRKQNCKLTTDIERSILRSIAKSEIQWFIIKLFSGRFWPSTKNIQVYGSIFSLEMVAHEEVIGCYQSWEVNLKKVGIFAHG